MIAVCLDCGDYASSEDELELTSCDAIEDYGHRRVSDMTDEQYDAWVTARSMGHGDGTA